MDWITPKTSSSTIVATTGGQLWGVHHAHEQSTSSNSTAHSLETHRDVGRRQRGLQVRTSRAFDVGSGSGYVTVARFNFSGMEEQVHVAGSYQLQRHVQPGAHEVYIHCPEADCSPLEYERFLQCNAHGVLNRDTFQLCIEFLQSLYACHVQSEFRCVRGSGGFAAGASCILVQHCTFPVQLHRVVSKSCHELLCV